MKSTEQSNWWCKKQPTKQGIQNKNPRKNQNVKTEEKIKDITVENLLKLLQFKAHCVELLLPYTLFAGTFTEKVSTTYTHLKKILNYKDKEQVYRQKKSILHQKEKIRKVSGVCSGTQNVKDNFQLSSLFFLYHSF